jgi:hypothetical protein
MARCRYQLVNYTDDGEYVLRSGDGDVEITDGVERYRRTVEIRCERCGRWSTNAGEAHSGPWVCFDTSCYYDEGEGVP